LEEARSREEPSTCTGEQMAGVVGWNMGKGTGRRGIKFDGLWEF
jgi:hypothetical protein